MPSPAAIFTKLKALYSTEEVKEVPAISVQLAVCLLLLYTVLYVAPLYATSTTRPSPQLSRDSPSVIRGRIKAVSWTCAMCSVSTFVLISSVEGGDPLRSLHNMGYFPPGLMEAAKCVTLTSLLFLGPLFEVGIAEGSWRDWVRLRGIGSLYTSWIEYRNLVAGPVTEEVLFRSCSVPLFLTAHASPLMIVFGTPVIFGLAHIHHFYEFRLTHPRTPLLGALLRSIFQLVYTTLFGAYATFLFLRTGSLLVAIVAHTFCNWMGLPRLWGRLEGSVETLSRPDYGENWQKRNEDQNIKAEVRGAKRLSIIWTLTYYILLVVGALGWWKMLWPLTQSKSALMGL